MKRFKMGILVGLFSLAFGMSVSAAEINVTASDDLTAKLAGAKSGDVLVLSDGTYTTNLSIDKDITIKGTTKEGTIIKGTVTISATDVKVLFDTLTLTNASTILKVDAKSTVDIKNSNVIYSGYNGTYVANSADGIWLTKKANGTVLNITDSFVAAKYAIWVYGEENVVTVKNSEISGYAAIDISNGTSSSTLAKNNKVTVIGSKLVGNANYSGSSDSYGTVVIGGQEGLVLNVDNSTITNVFTAVNGMDLILFSPAYKASINTEISLLNSKLENTDENNKSFVINYGTEEIQNGANVVAMEGTTITSKNDKVSNIVGEYITFTVNIKGSEAQVVLPKGSVVPESALKLDPVEGYTFGGWYTDDVFVTEFIPTEILNSDIKIYAKYTKNQTEPIVPEKPQVENPNTNDNVLTYVVLGGISLLGVALIYRQLKKSCK